MGRSQSKAFDHVERALGKNTLIKRSGVFGIFKNGEKKSVMTKGEGKPVDDRSQANINVCIPVFIVAKRVFCNKNNYQAYVILVKTASTTHVLFVGI